MLCVQVLRRHRGEPDLHRRGAADARALEDRGRGDLGQGHRLPRPQRPGEDQQAVLRLVQPGAHAHHHRAVGQVLQHGRRARRQGLGRQRSRHEADGRQHRLRAEEARGDGRARQHHHRLHHRQRRRDDHLPRRRHHPVQGRQADHLGRRHARAAGRALARAHRARHGQERHLRVARLAADARRHRRRPEGQRAEGADREGRVSRHRQDHARRRQPARLPRRQVGQVGARHLLLLLRQGPVGGPLQELEDVLRDGVRRPGGLPHRRDPLPLDPGRQHQARSVRDLGRRADQDAHRHGRRPRRTGHRLRLRLEHAADRPGAVAEGTRDLHRRSRRCRTRRATTSSRSRSRSRRR